MALSAISPLGEFPHLTSAPDGCLQADTADEDTPMKMVVALLL